MNFLINSGSELLVYQSKFSGPGKFIFRHQLFKVKGFEMQNRKRVHNYIL